MELAIISAAPVLLALLSRAGARVLSKSALTGFIAVPVVCLFGWLLTYLPAVSAGPLSLSVPWVPQLGLSLSIYLDGLSLLFGLIILGVGALVVLYSGSYFDDAPELSRFLGLLLPFMSAMLALVLAGNVLTLFIAWELTSILSFLLISFHGHAQQARAGALQALMITGAGGLALLVGAVLMGSAAGTMELPQIIASASLRDHPLYAVFTVLILLACFTKSAQFPFQFWLPGAMSAPTPASAYLHSATMVKAGIYLLARLAPALGDTVLWQTALLGIGLITLLVGAFLALRQRDLKCCLAYSTVAQLGAFVALLGLPHHEGITAALVGVLAHALYKAALFLVAGTIDHATGTRDLHRLGGLAAQMPGWAIVAALAGLSMAGLPPLLGFVAKETLLDAMLENPLALVVVVLSAALTVTMALILFWDVFMGVKPESDDHDEHPAHFHLAPRAMLIGPGVLAGGSLLAGVQLQALVVPIIAPGAGGDPHLSLFSGITPPLLLSLVAVVGGVGLFAARRVWRSWRLPELPGGAQAYESVVHGVERVGDLVLKTQGGKLRYYLAVILGALVVIQATAGFAHVIDNPLVFEFNPDLDVLRGLFLLLSVGAVLASVLFRRHLLAALALGVAGYAVGGLFLVEPAPDVALVQFMVETLGTVLLIIMLARIGAQERQQAIDNLWKQSRAGRTRDILLSVLIGTGVGLFALAAVTSRPKPETIATWHLDHALPEIGVSDVVGAIVTDFRGMDTIIEISVFSVAAIGVMTLLSGFKSRQETKTHLVKGHRNPDDDDPPVFNSRFSTPLTATVARLLLPLAFLIALVQLLYGGDAPGDGFTAGVISGLGVALWYVVFGYQETRERLRWLNGWLLIGGGVTLVLANAAAPMLFGEAFLTHISFDQIHLPANLHLSSTLIYETGIFLTVLGCASTIMEAIAFPKEVG